MTAPGRAAPIAAGLGLATALLVGFVTSGSVEIGARSVLWQWFAPGARLHDRVVLRLPALRRLEEGGLAIDARAASPAGAPLSVSVDGDPPSRVVLDPARLTWLAIPARGADGADVTLSPTGTKEPVSLPSMVGRPIVVNYPPLTITMWTLCWRMAQRWGVRLEPIEAQAVAVKVPPVAGDFLAVAVLLWIHHRRPWRAATLAALYWATPVSWLSGAVLGYQDGAYAPLAVIALAIAAGRGFWAARPSASP